MYTGCFHYNRVYTNNSIFRILNIKKLTVQTKHTQTPFSDSDYKFGICYSYFYMSLWFFFATLGNIVGPIVGTYIAASYGYEYAFYTSMGIVWTAILFFLSPT